MKKLFLAVGIIFLVGGQLGCGGPGLKSGAVALKAFQSCGELSEFLEERIGKTYEPVNPFRGAGTGDTDMGVGSTEEAEGSAAPDMEVEEADIVKQEGDRLYIVNNYGLLVYDVNDPGTPLRIGQVTLDLRPREIYVYGLQVAVIGSYSYSNGTRVVLVDLSDAASPMTVREYELDGLYANSRKVGPSIYLALQKRISPYNRKVEVSKFDPCDSVYAPENLEEDYGFTSWEIIGIDLDDPGSDPNKVTIIGSSSSEITATPDHFYLTNLFSNADVTGIYLLSLNPSEAQVTPRDAASVPGRIVDQFSLDESDGFFRIATTTNRSTFGAADNRNYLTVFNVRSGQLEKVGQIDSITPGESITAVKFLGERAFVTTYVTKDPLVTLDLSDPVNPVVRGELDVPGYASYLHPWGDFLISIGSTAEFRGEVILSLFDVSDLEHPKLIQQVTLEGSYDSEAETEHRAFSFFEERGILAIPVSFGWSGSSEVALFLIEPVQGFQEIGAIDHDDLTEGTMGSPQLRRSLEIGDSLYTISEVGLKVSSFGDFSESFGEKFPTFTIPVEPVEEPCCSEDLCGACVRPDF